MSAIVSLGSAVLDRITGQDAAGRPVLRELAGGAALNVAVGTRRLGIPTTLVAAVAADEAGTVIRDLLAAEDVQLIDAGNGRATTIVTSRRVHSTVEYAFSSRVPSGLLRFDSATLGLVRSASVLVMSAMRAGDAAGPEPLVAALQASPAVRVYDPNPRVREGDRIAAHRDEIEAIAGACDLIKLAREDLELLYPDSHGDIPAALLERGVAAVLITDGPNGATLLGRDLRVDVPSRIASAEVVDPMGAGDAVTAAISASFARSGWPVAEEEWTAVLDRAMRAAAIACRSVGGATAMPRAAELDGAEAGR